MMQKAFSQTDVAIAILALRMRQSELVAERNTLLKSAKKANVSEQYVAEELLIIRATLNKVLKSTYPGDLERAKIIIRQNPEFQYNLLLLALKQLKSNLNEQPEDSLLLQDIDETQRALDRVKEHCPSVEEAPEEYKSKFETAYQMHRKNYPSNGEVKNNAVEIIVKTMGANLRKKDRDIAETAAREDVEKNNNPTFRR